MSDPISFDSASPRFGLPLLYQGQSQKEVFVNEALARTDALLHCAVEGEATSPPAEPVEGSNWIVGAAATGDWEGQDNALACRQAGNWLFIPPSNGLRVYDKTLGQERFFDILWKKADAVLEPYGGSVVDSQARDAVGQLIVALQALGILPAS